MATTTLVRCPTIEHARRVIRAAEMSGTDAEATSKGGYPAVHLDLPRDAARSLLVDSELYRGTVLEDGAP